LNQSSRPQQLPLCPSPSPSPQVQHLTMTQLNDPATLTQLQVLVDNMEDQLGLAQLGLSLLRVQLAVLTKGTTTDPIATSDHSPTEKPSSPPPPSQNSGSSHKQHEPTRRPTKPSLSDWTSSPLTYSWSPQPQYPPAWPTSTNTTRRITRPFSEPSGGGRTNSRATSRKNNQNRRKDKNYYPEPKKTDIWKDPWRNKEYEDQLKEDQH
jgi:hypothetical protein